MATKSVAPHDNWPTLANLSAYQKGVSLTGHHGLRMTRQRRAVLDALRASRDHPTAAELLPRVQERSPGTGAATVYRALAVLVDAGLAEELSIGDTGATRFDGNVERHDHLLCTECGGVTDVVQPEPDLSGIAATGFTVTGYELRIHGTCGRCTASADMRT